jgi:integrase
MSKTLTEAQLTTKNARTKLAKGLHFRTIDPDTHLGYRKGVRGGKWIVRRYLGTGKYEQNTLGSADDALPADGLDTLDFGQASERARNWVIERRADEKAKASGPIITVRMAVEDYIKIREVRECAAMGNGSLKRDTRSRLTKYVLSSPLADIPLHRLDEDYLQNWKHSLPNTLAYGTVRRLSNDLKACLNRASDLHRKKLPSDFSHIIRSGLKSDIAMAVEARRQVLPDEQITEILRATKEFDAGNEWSGDLYRLIIVMAATGARQSQLQIMKVRDVQVDRNRLMIPVSKKGRGSKTIEHIRFTVPKEVLDILEPVITGRNKDATLLERWRHIQTGPMEWTKNRRGPWRSASELTRPWQEIIKYAGLPSDTLPYCLRHSSIVRCLRNGLPTRLVAALHDTSTAMIEKHYSAYIIDAMDEIVAKSVTSLI